MNKEERKDQRPEAYPKPTETDRQLDNQDEFIQPQSDKKNNDMPVLNEDAKANKSTRENSLE
jgi:hypothetical protein